MTGISIAFFHVNFTNTNFTKAAKDLQLSTALENEVYLECGFLGPSKQQMLF